MIQHAPCKGSVRSAALQCEIDLLRGSGTAFRGSRHAPVGELVEVGFEVGRQYMNLSLEACSDRGSGDAVEGLNPAGDLGLLWCSAVHEAAMKNFAVL